MWWHWGRKKIPGIANILFNRSESLPNFRFQKSWDISLIAESLVETY
jgi:hypothetical protein